LVAGSKPADVITVFEQLQRRGKAADCGGLAYLNALAQSVPSAANMRRYAEIVRERSILRKLMLPATTSPPAPSIRKAGRSARCWTRPKARSSRSARKVHARSKGFQGIDKLVVSLIDRVQELHDNGAEEVTGVRTGFYDLDRMTPACRRAT
jgi:replicative DNA helicase